MAFGAVAAVGGAFALVGMKKSWDPLPSVKAAGFTTVDLSPMQPGEFRQVEWRKKPIFIISLMIGAVSQLTGDINKGVGMLSLMFVIGILIFRCAVKED